MLLVEITMPVNDIICEECGSVEEYFYKILEKENLECRSCNSKKLKVLISASGIKTINSPEKLKDAIKTRSQEDHKKYAKDRLQRAKEKHGKHWF